MKEQLKYRALAFIRYFGDALFYPFFALYLENKNYGETKIGIILAIIPILAILTNPLYTLICRNLTITKNVLGIVSVIEALLIVAVAFSNSFVIILVLVILIALFGSSHYALMDALIANYSKTNNYSYASIRIYGSMAYIVATIFGGLVINISNYQVSFIIGATLFSLAGISYWFLKPVVLTKDEGNSEETRSLKTVLRTPDFLFFCLFYMLLMGTTYASDSFLGVYMESRGVNDLEYGFLFAYFVTLEVLTLLIMNKYFKNVNPHKALALAVICLLIRLIANHLYLPVIIVGLFCGLRGIGYGIVLAVAYPYVIRILGKANWSLGIMVLLFGYSLYVGVFNVLNGVIIDLLSYRAFYLINIVITTITLIIALLRIKRCAKWQFN